MACTILMPPFMRRFFFSTRTRWGPRRNTSPPRKPVRFFPKKKSCSMKPSRKQLQLRPAPPSHHHLHQRPDKLVATALWAVRNFATVGQLSGTAHRAVATNKLARGLHGFFHEGGRESL